MAEQIQTYQPNFGLPFTVYTDASDRGLAAGLYQEQDGAERPIVFISRKLRDAETRYGASNLECLAVVWALDKLHFYLDGAKFTLFTDCKAVRSLLSAKWAHRQLIRWQAAIQGYRGRITIKHRPGLQNSNADGPSREPLDNTRTNPAADLDPNQTIELGGVHIERPSLFGEGGTVQQPHPVETMRESNTMSRDNRLPCEDGGNDTSSDAWPAHLTADAVVAAIAYTGLAPEISTRLRRAVKADEIFSRLLHELEQSTASDGGPTDATSLEESLPTAVVRDLKQGRYHLLGGLLYRRTGLSSALVVLDASLQTQMLDACHDHAMAGHFSTARTLERIRQIPWWPKIGTSTEL